MSMWADNVKFVKEILDTKYHKIDSAVAEVRLLKKMCLSCKQNKH